jgi:hypothetical protein
VNPMEIHSEIGILYISWMPIECFEILKLRNFLFGEYSRVLWDLNLNIKIQKDHVLNNRWMFSSYLGLENQVLNYRTTRRLSTKDTI